MHHPHRLSHLAAGVVLSIASLALAACGDDAKSYSSPVGINLKAKSSEVQNAVVTDEKAINTESGNPYAAFVADARAALGGADPARIEVDHVDLLLGGNSTGVTQLGEIFDGEVDVLFVMNDSNNSYPVAKHTVSATTNAGPVGLDVTYDSSTLATDDQPKVLNGSFKVVLRGPAAAGFVGKNADADLQTTFTFAAY